MPFEGDSLSEEFDIVLLDAYAHGRRSAFDELYARHAGSVLRFAWSLVGTRTLAEDVVQETFLTLWAKRRSIRFADESLLPWLLVTARNHARNVLRRRAKHDAAPLDETLAASAPDEHLLIELLSGLTSSDRALVRLCLVEGYTYAEAAQALDTSPAAVGKRLERARIRLREAMADD
jgi:RNA polymerase sigma factor (sigma-70 family)